MTTTEHDGPLHGVRVVEACEYLAGPFAGLMLSDLGADVVKVEAPPRGDPYRQFAPLVRGVSTCAAAVNRGKRSVLLDLKNGGLADLDKLLVDADIFIESWRPGVAERLGVGDDHLAELNPRLVHVSIIGFGESGPDAERGAFDGVIQATSGVAGLDRDAGLSARAIPTYLADKATSVYVVQAALAALVQRQHTDRGAPISVAMIDALSYFNFVDLFPDYLPVGHVPDEPPRAFSSSVVRTRDGFVTVSASSGAQVNAVPFETSSSAASERSRSTSRAKTLPTSSSHGTCRRLRCSTRTSISSIARSSTTAPTR